MLKQIFALVSRHRTSQFVLLITFMVFKSLFELLSLASLLFFMLALSDPSAVMTDTRVLLVNDILSLGLSAENPGHLITLCSAVMMVTIIIKNALNGVSEYVITRFATAVGKDSGTALLGRILHSNYEWILSRKRSELIQTVEWRIHIGIYMISLMSLVSEAVVSIALLAALFINDPITGLVSVSVLGGIGFSLFHVLKKSIDKAALYSAEIEKDIFETVRNILNGIRDILISKSEIHYLNQFDMKSVIQTRKRALLVFIARTPVFMLETLGFVFLALGVIILINLNTGDLNTVLTTVYLFVVVAWRMLPGFNRILQNFSLLRANLPQVKQVINLEKELALHPHMMLGEAGSQQSVTIKEFSLQGISYRYKSRENFAVDDITFSIRQGEQLGVIGSSGAGKSTLVDIMVGLLHSQTGNVFINGMNARTINYEDWVRQIGYVAQSPFFFEGSIAENIGFGWHHENIDRGKLQQVCKQASMDFLDELQDGLDTNLGERGTQLSGWTGSANCHCQSPVSESFDVYF